LPGRYNEGEGSQGVEHICKGLTIMRDHGGIQAG
jgi:hypothetical protein